MMGFEGDVGMAAGQEFVLVHSSLAIYYGIRIYFNTCFYVLC